MKDEITYIDFDGVIVDSEQRMLERKYLAGFHDHKDKGQFYDYFEYTNTHLDEWDYIIRNAQSINNSVEIINELQILKKNIAILTKIHTLYEMKVKVDDIRNHRKITVPIIFVPPGAKKYEVIVPHNQLLIDDSKKNIKGWIENGGQGLIFDETMLEINKSKVKSLDFLLKR